MLDEKKVQKKWDGKIQCARNLGNNSSISGKQHIGKSSTER